MASGKGEKGGVNFVMDGRTLTHRTATTWTVPAVGGRWAVGVCVCACVRVCVCVCACVRSFVSACVHACVRARACVRACVTCLLYTLILFDPG